MKRAFADTSFYVAAVNPRDALHDAARTLASDFRGPVLTTEYVLIEVGNWLVRGRQRGVPGVDAGHTGRSSYDGCFGRFAAFRTRA